MLSSTPSTVAGQAAPAQPTAPHLERRSLDYWHCSDVRELAELLRRRSDLHEWIVAAGDRKADRELTRFYHRPATVRRRLPSSGVVLEHNGVVRVVGEAPERARAVLETYEGKAGQRELFGLEVAL